MMVPEGGRNGGCYVLVNAESDWQPNESKCYQNRIVNSGSDAGDVVIWFSFVCFFYGWRKEMLKVLSHFSKSYSQLLLFSKLLWCAARKSFDEVLYLETNIIRILTEIVRASFGHVSQTYPALSFPAFETEGTH